jgi:hypothetical protein
VDCAHSRNDEVAPADGEQRGSRYPVHARRELQEIEAASAQIHVVGTRYTEQMEKIDGVVKTTPSALSSLFNEPCFILFYLFQHCLEENESEMVSLYW